jgi:LysR family transcriptional regulator, nitrogen assimilation regulatory protein
METRALRYFQSVVEFGSYSRAAAFLRISQPAISRQITRLEKELGKALLIRGSQGAVPTEAGQLLFERGQSVLRQLENTVAEVRGMQASPAGTLAIAVPPGAGHFLVPALVRHYQQAYPEVLLKFVAGFSGYIHEALIRGRVDVACLHGPPPQKGFEVIPLVDEDVFLVGKRGMMPAGRTAVATKDLAHLPLILPSRLHSSRRLLDERASAQGLALNVALEVDDPSLIRSLLREGLGFSLLTQGAFLSEVAHHELEAIHFRPRISWPLALMTSAAQPRSALVTTLVGAIRTVVREKTADGSWPGKSLDR